MRKPNWDTDAGRRMWIAGKKDAEIADAFGISVHAVTCYRVKHWQQAMTPKRGKIKEQAAPVVAGEGVDPAVLDKIRDNAEKAGIQLPGVKQEIATSAAPPRNEAAGAAAPGSALAGFVPIQEVVKKNEKAAVDCGPMMASNPTTQHVVGSADLKEGQPLSHTNGCDSSPTRGAEDAEETEPAETEPAEVPVLEEQEQPKVPSRDALDAIADALKVLQGLAVETIPQTPQAAPAPFTQGSHVRGAEDKTESAGYTVPRPRLDEMDIVAAATEHLSGMKAVCTACAIQALWFWTGPADLRRAKKNIDWLLDHMEG